MTCFGNFLYVLTAPIWDGNAERWCLVASGILETAISH